MKKTLFLGVIVAICSFFGLVHAQNITVPYSMGFEDSGFDLTEATNWVLNPGAQSAACGDKWMIGRSIREAGVQSLYITTGTNGSASFGNQPCTQYVYRDFLLPQGTYDISFDWYCEGAPGSYLAVGYVLTTNTYLVANSSAGTIPAQVSPYLQFQQLNGSADARWQNATFSFTSNGTRVYRIFFAWVNNNVDPDLHAIGACIDNIQMTTANCKRPANITYNTITCDSIFVSWTGSSAEYELQYRQAGSNYWHKIVGIPGGVTSGTILEGMDESSYDLRVRGICTPDTSAWAYLTDFVVFCPDKHCINLVDLNAPGTTCTYGSGYDGYYTNPQCAYQNIGVIDYGPENELSRHTINWDRTATDPRTGGNIPLVPAGEIASVRLGNWKYNAEAEAITYDYYVDSIYNILLIKYACVMEDPGHLPHEQPRFVLDILDAHGQQIDPTCGHCDFAADGDAEGWYTYGTGYNMVTYKPWTLVGLNLQNYRGMNIKIRFTTYDCSQGGHYGYAYYTMSCAAGTIKSNSCAGDPLASTSLAAPEGFLYEWYNKQGQMVSTNRVLDIASSDTTTYTCRLKNKENPSCWFELKSQCLPQQPMADFTYQYNPRDCKNMVDFEEHCFVRTTYGGDTVDHMDNHCDEVQWEFWGPNGFQKMSNRRQASIEFPSTGGIFQAKLTAILGGNCTGDTTMQIILPAIRDYRFDIDSTICEGSVIRCGDQLIGTSGEHTVELKTRAGCDSIIHFTVTVNPTYSETLDTVAICYGEDYCVDGDCYGRKTSGMFIRHLSTVLGCDSSLMQWVIVHDSIAPKVTQDSIDLDIQKFTADLHFTGTGYNRVVFNGDTMDYNGVELLISNLGVGYYMIEYLSEYDCSLFDTILIGGACLNVTLSMQTECLSGMPVVEYPFVVDSGMVTTYAIRFDADALEMGFTDTTNCEPKKEGDDYTIAVPVPTEALPGKYNATIVFTDPVCGDLPVPVTVTITFPMSIIFSSWGDVISIKSAEAAGYDPAYYTFTSYQWMLNGEPIVGATESYWYQEGGLDMNGSYTVVLTLADGTVLETCPYVPALASSVEDTEADVFLLTNVGRAGESLPVGVGTDATATIYSASGQMVSEQALYAGGNLLTLPRVGGIYILNVRTRKGTATSRILVK